MNCHTTVAILRSLGVFAILLAVGCGTTKARRATEQLLVSDAVDQAIADIDFGALAGQKIYFDTRYIVAVKGVGFVNSEYIISSLRQQMTAADCRLQVNEADADFVVEARVGTLGTNGHEVVYGVPANNTLATAASFLPNTPPVPTIPELSIAKKDAQIGAAKIAAFAYERESRRPIWQSGTSQAKSTAQDYWIFGAGPFQRGSIYEGTQFAGSRIRIPRFNHDGTPALGPQISYKDQFFFPRSVAPPNLETGIAGQQGHYPPTVLGPTYPPGSERVARLPQTGPPQTGPPQAGPPQAGPPQTGPPQVAPITAPPQQPPPATTP